MQHIMTPKTAFPPHPPSLPLSLCVYVCLSLFPLLLPLSTSVCPCLSLSSYFYRLSVSPSPSCVHPYLSLSPCLSLSPSLFLSPCVCLSPVSLWTPVFLCPLVSLWSPISLCPSVSLCPPLYFCPPVSLCPLSLSSPLFLFVPLCLSAPCVSLSLFSLSGPLFLFVSLCLSDLPVYLCLSLCSELPQLQLCQGVSGGGGEPPFPQLWHGPEGVRAAEHHHGEFRPSQRGLRRKHGDVQVNLHAVMLKKLCSLTPIERSPIENCFIKHMQGSVSTCVVVRMTYKGTFRKRNGSSQLENRFTSAPFRKKNLNLMSNLRTSVSPQVRLDQQLQHRHPQTYPPQKLCQEHDRLHHPVSREGRGNVRRTLLWREG